MFTFSRIGVVDVVFARSFATHFTPSQYPTCESFSDVRTSMFGYGFLVTFEYGSYDFMETYAVFSFGLPHSMYSCVVSGSVGSSIVLITSTNGTYATTALNRSGRMFVTAPISSPPALPPLITSFDGVVYFSFTRCSAAATKSVNVFFFVIIRPASCHSFPMSPPPRMCASAKTTPRSSSTRRAAENSAFDDTPYEPYAVSQSGFLPPCASTLFL